MDLPTRNDAFFWPGGGPPAARAAEGVGAAGPDSGFAQDPSPVRVAVSRDTAGQTGGSRHHRLFSSRGWGGGANRQGPSVRAGPHQRFERLAVPGLLATGRDLDARRELRAAGARDGDAGGGQVCPAGAARGGGSRGPAPRLGPSCRPSTAGSTSPTTSTDPRRGCSPQPARGRTGCCATRATSRWSEPAPSASRSGCSRTTTCPQELRPSPGDHRLTRYRFYAGRWSARCSWHPLRGAQSFTRWAGPVSLT